MKLVAAFVLNKAAAIGRASVTSGLLRENMKTGNNVSQSVQGPQARSTLACTPFTVLVAASVAVFVFLLASLLLPVAIAGAVQNVLGWALAGSVAALSIASLLGALENLLGET